MHFIQVKLDSKLFVLTIFCVITIVNSLKLSSAYSEWTNEEHLSRCLEIKDRHEKQIRRALLLPYGTSYYFYCSVCLGKQDNLSIVWYFVPTGVASFLRILHKKNEHEIEYFGSLFDRRVRQNGTYYCRESNGRFKAIYSVTVIRVWHGLQEIKHIASESEKFTPTPVNTILHNHEMVLNSEILHHETECSRCDNVGLTREVYACFMKLKNFPEKYIPIFNKLREFGKLPCHDPSVETLFTPDGQEMKFIKSNPVRVYYHNCNIKCPKNKKVTLNATKLSVDDFNKERIRLKEFVSKQKFSNQVRIVGQECVFSCFQSLFTTNSLNEAKLQNFYWIMAHASVGNTTISKQNWLSPLHLNRNSKERMGFDFLGNLYIIHLLKGDFDYRYLCMWQGTMNASHRLIKGHSSFSLSDLFGWTLPYFTLYVVAAGFVVIFIQKLRNPEIDSKIY